jgi:hypothetical protein
MTIKHVIAQINETGTYSPTKESNSVVIENTFNRTHTNNATTNLKECFNEEEEEEEEEEETKKQKQ